MDSSRRTPAFFTSLRHRRVGVGEVRFANGAAILETVLGSCVAAAFWHPERHMGALCHGALPECPEEVARTADISECLRYVDYAMGYILGRLRARGIDPSELEVKLFGGSNVITAITDSETATIGDQNCAAAKRVLEQEGLRLTASDLGGTRGRVIYFRTDTGEVLLRRLKETALLQPA